MTKTVQTKKNELKNICLLGVSMDTTNNGVKALSASLIRLMTRIYPGKEICLLTASRSSRSIPFMIDGNSHSVSVVNYRLSPRSKFQQHLFTILLFAVIWRIIPIKAIRKKIEQKNRWIGTIRNSLYIGDICGGDSFSDIYGLQRMILDSIPRIIILLCNKKYLLLPQTYGPFTSKYSKIIARYFIKQAVHIFSRDMQSISLIKKEFKTPEAKISLCPDVAFTLESHMPADSTVCPPLQKSKHELLGLNISGLLFTGGYTGKNMFGLAFDYKDFTNRLIEHLIAKSNIDILLIPHTFSSDTDQSQDLGAIKKIYDSFKEVPNIHYVSKEFDQYNIKGIIGTCDFFIGARMHSCIAALSQCIPAVGVAYSKKFIGVYSSIGVNDLVLDARKLESTSMITQIDHLFQKRNEYKTILQNKLPTIKQTIEEQLTNITN